MLNQKDTPALVDDNGAYAKCHAARKQPERMQDPPHDRFECIAHGLEALSHSGVPNREGSDARQTGLSNGACECLELF
jgi:hypothetical protein